MTSIRLSVDLKHLYAVGCFFFGFGFDVSSLYFFCSHSQHIHITVLYCIVPCKLVHVICVVCMALAQYLTHNTKFFPLLDVMELL